MNVPLPAVGVAISLRLGAQMAIEVCYSICMQFVQRRLLLFDYRVIKS